MFPFKEKKTETLYKDWGEPGEIKTSTPRVARMTEDLMPTPLKDWLKDVSHRMQTPADFSTISAVVMFASVIGSACSIRPKQEDSWEVIPNLWGACIGQPSVMLKSPSMQEAMSMLEKLQAHYGEEYEHQKSQFKADELERELKLKDIERRMKDLARGKGITGTVEADAMAVLKTDYAEISKELEQTPQRRLFKTNETTVQSMTLIQEQNERGILVFRDELVALLLNWDKEQNADERGYFLEGWNGNGTYTDMKISRGLTEAKNICISLLGGIQPDKLKRYLLQAIKGNNDGLLQRLQLAVWPENPDSWSLVDQKPNYEARDHVEVILFKLAECDFKKLGANENSEKNRPFFRFDVQAQKIFNDWLTELQTQKIPQEDNPLMLEHFGKYRSLMPSLSLIFHCLDSIDSSYIGPIKASSAQLAVRWCDYLESHARKIYSMIDKDEEQAAIILSKKIEAKALANPFTAKTVYNKGWYGLKDRVEVEAACRVLIDQNWLQIEAREPNSSGGRRPLPIYRINPGLL
ncbi:YfjI family protein [Methylophaga thiooxydans]|uniref:DUF3987 domain-containing protein n=1 Tax=Methylophaga thiooxydans DMS010 TaxID=637616 RepID=C0N618_9GAMM|nr:YfjI family protein [Methylophaga thiooxydans]EEF79991.1 hypothetical protein MDMS009_1542 [Methylophaga thiooxydans DMS010]